MTDNNQPTGSLFERCVSRREMLITTGGAVAGALLVGCGGQQQGSAPGKEEESAPPVAGNFVGEAPDAEAFVALVAASPEEEGENEREVRAYLCDGESISEWFIGPVAGNELDLSSEGGARLEGNLTPQTSTGTITLDDDRSFTYTADPAIGIAGLYNVIVSEGGQLRGFSESGGQLEGQIAQDPQDGGDYPVRGTITAPDGQTVDFELYASDEEAGEEHRWIVSEDGEVKGARKGAATGSSLGFIDPTANE